LASWREEYDELMDHFRNLNFDNFLGYGRATTSGDPTPSKDFRHLILLSNEYECRMHIQISATDLANRNFDAVTLEWVEFD
jgi:hypothetical protein